MSLKNENVFGWQATKWDRSKTYKKHNGMGVDGSGNVSERRVRLSMTNSINDVKKEN